MSDQAEPQKTKAELFAECPERFEDSSTFKLCIKMEGGKYLFLLDPNMSDVEAYVVRGMAWDRMVEYQAVRGMQKAKQEGSGLIVPGQEEGRKGFRSFLKNGRR